MAFASRLFESNRHIAVASESWNEQYARSYLQTLLEGIKKARKSDGHWPDELGAFSGSIYAGVAGIAWTLDQLHLRGYLAEHQSGLCTTAVGEPETSSADAALFGEYKVPVSHSFYLGSSGIELQQWKETGAASRLDSLHSQIINNQQHPWMENLWGAPSTMLVASHLLSATGEARFSQQIRSGAAYMEERLEDHPDVDCQMWNIDLYGERTWLLGAGHGFVGNVFPIIRSPQAFDKDTMSRWRERIINTAMRTAERDNGMANWGQSIGNAREGRDSMLVQQCHGAPGFIIALSSLMKSGNPEFDLLMLEAGELVWQAGPLDKYPGLCHGTPGNGYALLKLYKTTNDSTWLSRARTFAMSAIKQHSSLSTVDPASHRYSLWDGDAGLAMYLADCIDARAEFPTLDYF